MQYTTSAALCATVRVLPARIHALAVVCLVALALLGVCLEVSAGWCVWPPVVYVAQVTARPLREVCGPAVTSGLAVQWWLSHTWYVPICRSRLRQIVWWASGHSGPAVGALLPWLVWGVPLASVRWPALARQPEWWLVKRLGLLWLPVSLALDYLGASWLPTHPVL